MIEYILLNGGISMNYETVIRNIEISKTVTISHVNEVVEELLAAYDEEQMESWERIFRMFESMQTAQIYNGSSDDYHNLAVSLARVDQYNLACDVLEIGLQFYEESIDLLADYLEYAHHCDKISEAQAYFEKLMKIEKKKWNWRAFNFSIDYLSVRITKTSDRKLQEEDNACIDELLKQFQEYHKKDEKAYFAEYTVATSRNEEEKAILKLEEFVNNSNFKTTRCSIKIAQYYFDMGEYEKAENYIKKCKTYVTTPELSVEPGYIYVLSALCGMCRLYADGIDKLDKEGMEKRVEIIYKDCKAASAIYRRHKFSRYKELETQRDILERLTEIAYIE